MNSFYNKVIKRGLDFLFALALLVLGLPFLLIGILLIKIDSKGPVFFSQERIGHLNKPFTIYKLRTMSLETHRDGIKLRDRERVTKSGRIIRKLSIDELPQLINILRGDMSFVGPRPLLPRYYPYYTDEELKRHDVRPGITGLAQIKGRGNLQWEERFSYDLYYVNNLSPLLDLQIVLKTIQKVIKSEGTSTVRPPNLVDFDVHRNFEKRRQEIK